MITFTKPVNLVCLQSLNIVYNQLYHDNNMQQLYNNSNTQALV